MSLPNRFDDGNRLFHGWRFMQSVILCQVNDRIRNPQQNVTKSFKAQFEIISIGEKGDPTVLLCSSESEKLKWVQAFNNASQIFLESVRRNADKQRPYRASIIIPFPSVDAAVDNDTLEPHDSFASKTPVSFSNSPSFFKKPTAAADDKGLRKSGTLNRKKLANMVSVADRLIFRQFRRKNEGSDDTLPAVSEPRLVIGYPSAPLSSADSYFSNPELAFSLQAENVDSSPDLAQYSDGSVWAKTLDLESGNIYYFNVVTRESSWTLPEGQAVALESQIKIPEYPAAIEKNRDWRAAEDDTGNMYFFNLQTNEASWMAPGETISNASTPMPYSVEEDAKFVDQLRNQLQSIENS